MPNHLTNERSPYLQQHAQNPVDWYPWGTEAFERARALRRPILLSIGYAACHWCHVMAHESFEDPETADLMNRLYVNIKVDREERPDVDSIYMEAVQAITGSGGWPLNVFLTPDLRPFFGGTYFPPEPRHGMPSWSDVLSSVSRAFSAQADDVEHNAASLTDYIRRMHARADAASQPRTTELDRAFTQILAQADTVRGGFGGAPKFPQPLALSFLLQESVTRNDAAGRRHVVDTLTAMAEGGLYDQIGGGFHRYSVDDHWLVPHFEKMLYDNALLVPLYVDAYLVTGRSLFRTVAEETLAFMEREMRAPEGAFYASLDADSDGQEGSYYLWTPEDLQTVLQPELRPLAARRYGISPGGNFEGRTIPTAAATVEEIALELGRSDGDIDGQLRRVRAALLEHRQTRAAPGTDRKVLTSWNALAIRAFARAGAALGRAEYVHAAKVAADFLEQNLTSGDGLLRVWLEGPGTITGFLEDYAYLAGSLIDLYEATFVPEYLSRAERLLDDAARLFGGEPEAPLFDVVAQSELPVRPRTLFDNPIPSGNAAFASACERVSALQARDVHSGTVDAIYASASAYLSRAPLAVPALLSALAFDVRGATQVAIVSDVVGEGPLTQEVRRTYLPYAVVAAGSHAPPELLRGRETRQGEETAYVCRNFACDLPTSEVGKLRGQLATVISE